ncbi:MAG: pirin family protein [Saccharospirillum sp.]|nr:pirin family protein [Saccharospirillum sp.]
MSSDAILAVVDLGFPWQTADPFLFCVHHNDAYPVGNEQMGPKASLAGRQMGQDFDWSQDWRMYHGDTVPGFPAHPHRGFETITVVTEGYVDHADSLGAAGRYGGGDTQWMTAGKGVQHSEMFPLISDSKPNPMELFQIWINLPAKAKMAEPHFAMLWREDIPRLTQTDTAGRNTLVTVVAGELAGERAPSPPPDSWAADPANDVAVWVIEMDADAQWTLPAALPGVNRVLYFYEGDQLTLADRKLKPRQGAQLQSDVAMALKAGAKGACCLLLQGKPIGEPVAKHGPFVMNTEAEIREAFEDFRRDEFGGWPWPRYDQVHDRPRGRFARHADGREEEKEA